MRAGLIEPAEGAVGRAGGGYKSESQVHMRAPRKRNDLNDKAADGADGTKIPQA